jgi:hypothetical protein
LVFRIVASGFFFPVYRPVLTSIDTSASVASMTIDPPDVQLYATDEIG